MPRPLLGFAPRRQAVHQNLVCESAAPLLEPALAALLFLLSAGRARQLHLATRTGSRSADYQSIGAPTGAAPAAAARKNFGTSKSDTRAAAGSAERIEDLWPCPVERCHRLVLQSTYSVPPEKDCLIRLRFQNGNYCTMDRTLKRNLFVLEKFFVLPGCPDGPTRSAINRF
jgi:hypothetical protein